MNVRLNGSFLNCGRFISSSVRHLTVSLTQSGLSRHVGMVGTQKAVTQPSQCCVSYSIQCCLGCNDSYFFCSSFVLNTIKLGTKYQARVLDKIHLDQKLNPFYSTTLNNKDLIIKVIFSQFTNTAY